MTVIMVPTGPARLGARSLACRGGPGEIHMLDAGDKGGSRSSSVDSPSGGSADRQGLC